MTRVLIVDDEEAFRRMLEATVRAAGFDVDTADSGERALEVVAARVPDLVFLDLRMGARRMSGIETLQAVRASGIDVPVVMVTAFGDVQAAVGAMKAGALDFLEKPIDLEEIRRILRAVLLPDGREAPSPERPAIPFGGITPADGPMRAALELLDAAARSDVPVLISGESGTGKELAASFVHERSARSSGPLVKVNCAAIPAGLLESEMFGCEPGAFTGALAREGRFAAAAGGTLLLDEIAEMDPALQAKLLRVLQEKEFEPVGQTRTRRVDVRIVASTNRRIADAISSGAFREDLYFRLNVFEVILPPLRHRPADILSLARHMLRKMPADRPRRLAIGTEELICAHLWPGNVRELANALERASIMARGGVIRPEHLPPDIGRASLSGRDPQPFSPRAGASVHEMERELIERTLAATGGNRTRAAGSLGMSRRALLYKIKRYGIDG